MIQFGSYVKCIAHQYQSVKTAYDMMFGLNEIFKEQNHAAGQVAIKGVVKRKIVEGTQLGIMFEDDRSSE